MCGPPGRPTVRIYYVTKVRGHGRQGGITLVGRSGAYQVDLLPRVQINIVGSGHNVEKTGEPIRQAAQTGHMGDGIISR